MYEDPLNENSVMGSDHFICFEGIYMHVLFDCQTGHTGNKFGSNCGQLTSFN